MRQVEAEPGVRGHHLIWLDMLPPGNVKASRSPGIEESQPEARKLIQPLGKARRGVVEMLHKGGGVERRRDLLITGKGMLVSASWSPSGSSP